MRYLITVISIWLVASSSLHAQSDLSLHFMPRALQTSYTNPAFMNKKLISIGLPGVSISGNHTGFSMDDLITPVPGSDSLMLNVDQALSKMDDRNTLQFNTKVHALDVQVKLGKLQVGVGVGANASGRLNYPKELIELGWKGNEAYIGETMRIGPEVHAFSYGEIGLSVAYKVTKKLNIGIRGKYLIGVADLSTPRFEAALTTHSKYYELSLQTDYQINTSTLDLGTVDEWEDFSDLKPTFEFDPSQGNRGLALDIGATYEISDRITVAASLIDWGGIKWTDGVTQYSLTGNADFSGVDATVFFDSDSAEMEAVLDSLLDQLTISSREEAYRTQLTRKIYLSGTFSPIKSLRLSGLYYMSFAQGQTNSAIALSASKDLGKIFTGGLTYSIQNKRFDNIGANILLKLGPIMFYGASDNVLAFLNPKKAQFAHLRFGTNITF